MDQLSFLIEKAHTTGFKYDVALSFKDSQQPIPNPLLADTLQVFDVVQNGSQMLIDGGFLKKAGNLSWGQNTLKSQATINKSAGYVFSFDLIPQGGSLKFGLENLFLFYLDAVYTQIYTVSKYSSVGPKFVYELNKIYKVFIIIRNNGAFWILKDGSEYYLLNCDSFNTELTMKLHVDFGTGNSSLGCIRSKQCEFTDWYFDTFSATNPTTGLTFTHSEWIVFKMGTGANGSIIFRKQDANNYYKLSFASNLGTLSEVVNCVETVIASNMSGFSPTAEIKIICNGAELKIFSCETTAIKVNLTNSKFTGANQGELILNSGSLGYIKSMPVNVTAFDLTELEEITFLSEPLPSGFQEVTIYASPTGSGDGTEQNPYSLATAISKLGPGKTLALLSGTYQNQTFVLNTSGTEVYPIIIKPIGWVKIDAGDVKINGSYIHTDSSEGILEIYTDSWTGDRFVTQERFDFSVDGAYVNIDSWFIHDFGNVGFSSSAIDSKFKGCLIYNIGRGNGSLGHSMYTQNITGLKHFDSCIFMVNYDSAFALHEYGSQSSNLKGFRYNKCVFVNGRNLVGGSIKAEDTEFEDCTIIRGNVEFGLWQPADVVFENGRLFDSPLNIKKCDYLVFKNNYITLKSTSQGNMVNVLDGDIDDNHYVFYGELPYTRFNVNYVYGTLQDVKNATPFETNSQETVLGTGQEPQDDIIVDVFGIDRAIVTIVNYSEASIVDVELSGLESGFYYAYNAQNPDESFDFNHDGSAVSFAMTGWTKSVPIGTAGGQMNQNAKALTFPIFGVFYITKH